MSEFIVISMLLMGANLLMDDDIDSKPTDNQTKQTALVVKPKPSFAEWMLLQQDDEPMQIINKNKVWVLSKQSLVSQTKQLTPVTKEQFIRLPDGSLLDRKL